jgi:hypothetical protein
MFEAGSPIRDFLQEHCFFNSASKYGSVPFPTYKKQTFSYKQRSFFFNFIKAKKDFKPQKSKKFLNFPDRLWIMLKKFRSGYGLHLRSLFISTIVQGHELNKATVFILFIFFR